MVENTGAGTLPFVDSKDNEEDNTKHEWNQNAVIAPRPGVAAKTETCQKQCESTRKLYVLSVNVRVTYLETKLTRNMPGRSRRLIFCFIVRLSRNEWRFGGR